jgi:rRNA small subunit pseudouridine methyltransferase Nep1
MLHLVIAETELELIPEELHSNSEIKNYCRSRGKKPDKCVLDANQTPNATISISNGAVRGRPEILHICLLNALESDLYRNEKIQIWVHTRQDKVIKIDHRFRIPRMYSRFLSLMEELFDSGQVPPEGLASLTLEEKTLKNLVKSIKPSKTYILSKQGKNIKKSTLIKQISKSKKPLIIVGGFTDRDFSEKTKKLTKEIYSISENQLMSWSVLGAVVYALS